MQQNQEKMGKSKFKYAQIRAEQLSRPKITAAEVHVYRQPVTIGTMAYKEWEERAAYVQIQKKKTMAAETWGQRTRKFTLRRENGEKTGRPVWAEYVENLPPETKGRKFISAPNGAHYELFPAVSGYITGVRSVLKDFSGERERWIVVDLVDEEGTFKVEVGRIDGQYAINLMRRLISPNFFSKLKTRLQPYQVEADNGKSYLGVAVWSGPDKVEAVNDHPEVSPPEQVIWRGETKWDFMPVANSLFELVEKIQFEPPAIVPDVIGLPEIKSITITERPAPAPEAGPNPSVDDLPF